VTALEQSSVGARTRAIDLDPCTDPRWACLVERTDAGLFASPLWLRALADGFGLSATARVVEDATGMTTSGLAYVEVDDEKGERTVSLPFSDYSDPLGCLDREDWELLMEPFTGGDRPFSIRTSRQEIVGADPLLIESGRAAWHGRSLEPDENDLWHAISSSARQNIRKAQRAGLTVCVGTSLSALEDFHRLHVHLRKRKYRMLAQPVEYFRAIGEHFGPQSCAVVSASRGGDDLAGVVLLKWGDTAYYKFNASTPDGYDLRANDLVMWESLRLAQRWGCTRFDFGLSGLDQAGLLRYKAKYASEAAELVTLRTVAAPSPAAEKLTRTLGPLTQLLTDPGVPDDVACRAGGLLYRLFC
jgi:hypothetical protein